MGFAPGSMVALKGHAIPMVVETIAGDDVTVVYHDPKTRKPTKMTCKSVVLQDAPRRGGAISFRF